MPMKRAKLFVKVTTKKMESPLLRAKLTYQVMLKVKVTDYYSLGVLPHRLQQQQPQL
jgi:hypothetical protein